MPPSAAGQQRGGQLPPALGARPRAEPPPERMARTGTVLLPGPGGPPGAGAPPGRGGRPGSPGRRSAPGRPAHRRLPVFADLSGRRMRWMRLAGIGTGAVLASCLAVMAVGLLGGPKAPFIPWSALHQGGGSGGSPSARQAGRAATATPTPDVRPVAPRPSTTRPAGSPGPSAATSAIASPLVTNRASKTPPGLNRTPPPRHTSAP